MSEFTYGMDIEVGTHCLVKPTMRFEAISKEFIDKICVVIHKNKSGMYQVKVRGESNGRKVTLPKSCLEQIDYELYCWCV